MDLSLPISVPGGSNKDVVNLSHRNLTANDLLWLSKDLGGSSSHQITTIKLGYNDLRDEGAKIISSLLSQHRSITCLDLGFCQIGDDGIEALCQTLTYNTSLKILYLSGNSITENGCKYLGNALQANKSLDALYLTGNSGKAKGAKYIAKGLKFNQSITKLFLNGNKIEKEGASSISDTLITNHSITHLSLSDNNIGDSGLLSLSEAMANHRNLVDLELSFSKITAVGMTSFIDSLIGYNSLRHLLLDNNKLGDQGAKSLALALQHMQLEDLNIGFNEIGSEGLMPIIAYALNPMSSITSLALSGNTIDNNVAKELANMLIVNVRLAELYIDRTNLTNVGERFVATGIASNKVCPLRIVTGFELGKVLTQLGSPGQVANMSNEQALKYLAQVWRDLERQHQQLIMQQQAAYIAAHSNMGTLNASTTSGMASAGTSSPSELSVSEAESQAPTQSHGTAFTVPPVSTSGYPNAPNIMIPTPVYHHNHPAQQHPKRTRSSASRSGHSRTPPHTARTPPHGHARTPPTNVRQQQIQQLHYQQQIERYHALLEAARQVNDLPFDAREWQVLQDFYYTPPSQAEENMANQQQQQQQIIPSFRSESAGTSDASDGSDPASSAAASVDGSERSSITTATIPAAGQVHERSGTEESPRPWKRASNLSTVPRINYFMRIKALMDDHRANERYSHSLALLRQLRMLEISLLGLDALEIEEIMLRDVLGIGKTVHMLPVTGQQQQTSISQAPAALPSTNAAQRANP